jgi:hypothetical protein
VKLQPDFVVLLGTKKGSKEMRLARNLLSPADRKYAEAQEKSIRKRLEKESKK